MNIYSLKRMVLAAAMVLTAGMAHAVTYLAVDLNPSGFTRSDCLRHQRHTAGRLRVAHAGNQWHALLWNGTAKARSI